METATVNLDAISYETKMIVGEDNYHYEGPTLFAPNDVCLHRKSGELLVVVGGFGNHLIDKHGMRKGYAVRNEDGKIFFYPAGSLTDLKGRARHLQLVRTSTKRVRSPRAAATK